MTWSPVAATKYTVKRAAGTHKSLHCCLVYRYCDEKKRGQQVTTLPLGLGRMPAWITVSMTVFV
jgi:hypothetical protein